MDPITTTSLIGATVYLTKDAVEKLLGPTTEYLGEGLKGLVERRIQNTSKIFSVAFKRLGDRINDPGQIPSKVLKIVINDASYCDDNLVLEYIGGALASSRSENGRDDRGARMMKMIDNMSTYQIRSHYLIYATVSQLFQYLGRRFGTSEDRDKLQIFLPLQEFIEAMSLSSKESRNGQIMSHIFDGLSSDGLIEGRWRFGARDSLKKLFSDAPSDGIVCEPSLQGAELFMWAFGHGSLPLESMLTEQIDTKIDGLPYTISGASATKN